MSEKIYCGNAKIVNTSFGDLTKISFSKDDINKMVGHMKAGELDWINLVLKEKRDPQPGKPTHYLEVDTWKPSDDKKPEAKFETEYYNQVEANDDLDLPF